MSHPRALSLSHAYALIFYGNPCSWKFAQRVFLTTCLFLSTGEKWIKEIMFCFSVGIVHCIILAQIEARLPRATFPAGLMCASVTGPVRIGWHVNRSSYLCQGRQALSQSYWISTRGHTFQGVLPFNVMIIDTDMYRSRFDVCVRVIDTSKVEHSWYAGLWKSFHDPIHEEIRAGGRCWMLSGGVFVRLGGGIH